MKNFDTNKKLILKRLGVGEEDFLGKGVESFVYKYKKDQVVRILKEGNLEYLNSLQKLQKLIGDSQLLVKTPQILGLGKYGETVYTTEKRFDGQNLSKIFDSFTDKQKSVAVLNYFNVLTEFAKVNVDKFKFGQIVSTKDKISEDRWCDFINKKVEQKTDSVRSRLLVDVINFEEKLERFKNISSERLTQVNKDLVHGDYFYDNVMMNNEQKVTGVLDFSGWTTVIGDFRLDIAGSIIFLEHSEKFAGYQKMLLNVAKARFGQDLEWFVKFYRIYYCLFLSDSYLYLKPLYKWCVKNLNDELLWKDILK